MPIDELDLDEVDWALVRHKYIDASIPVVLRRKGGQPIAEGVVPPDCAVRPPFAAGSLRVTTMPMSSPFPGLDEIVRHAFPGAWRAVYPVWFTGEYKAGFSHLDQGPCCSNLYYLRRGSKDVIILPRDVSESVGPEHTSLPSGAKNAPKAARA